MEDEEKPWAAYAEYWKNTLAAVSLTFAIIPTIVYGLRVYSSHMVSKRVRPDDILMGAAVIFMWGNTASVCLKAFNGIGVPHDHLSPEQDLRLNLGSWLIVKFWALSMVCVKLSILLFLNHLLGTTRRMRITLLVVGICCVAWACVPFFYTIFFCKPVAYYWDRDIYGQCVDNHKYMAESIAVAVLSLVTDLVILAIPIPTVWNLQMKRKQKIAVTCILCVGLIVCVFSLLRVVYFGSFQTKNLSTSSNLQSLFTILENDFAILCGCMPQLKPLFAKLTGDSAANTKSTKSHKHSQSANAQEFDYREMRHVRATMGGAGSSHSPSDLEEGRNTELRGVESPTTSDHDMSAGSSGERDDRKKSHLSLSAGDPPSIE